MGADPIVGGRARSRDRVEAESGRCRHRRGRRTAPRCRPAPGRGHEPDPGRRAGTPGCSAGIPRSRERRGAARDVDDRDRRLAGDEGREGDSVAPPATSRRGDRVSVRAAAPSEPSTFATRSSRSAGLRRGRVRPERGRRARAVGENLGAITCGPAASWITVLAPVTGSTDTRSPSRSWTMTPFEAGPNGAGRSGRREPATRTAPATRASTSRAVAWRRASRQAAARSPPGK